MTAYELIDRYVYAATRRIPRRKNREDIAKELRSLIDDMLTERCNGLEPEEKDARVVIAEIGTPLEVYRKYSPYADGALLSGEYYENYIYLMQILMACMGLGLSVAYIVMGIAGAHETVWHGISGWFTSIVASFCGCFTFITIIFAVLQRKNIEINILGEELNTLPPAPKKNEAISRTDNICSIVFCAIFFFVFVFTPQIICIPVYVDGVFTPVFNIKILQTLWPAFLLFSATGIFDSALRIFEGRYTFKVLLSSIVTNAISLILAFIMFGSNKILHTNFTNSISEFMQGNNIVVAIFSNFNLFMLGVIIFAIALDLGENIYRYIKTNK